MHQRKILDVDVGYLPERPKSVIPSPSPKKVKAIEMHRPLSAIESPSNKSYNEFNSNLILPKKEYCNNYQILRKIGTGSFGKVYKVKGSDNKTYALKKIPLKQNMSRYDASCIITEIKVGGANKCKYLLSIKDVFIKNNEMCLITDYARKGDLSNYIKSRKYKNRPLEEGLIWSILLQMLIGVEYLHHYNIIHRDIKSLNIFLTSDYKVLMGDFGISKILRSDSFGTRTQIGTPLYSSPEIVKKQTYNNKVDVWALGCVLWEMMSMTHAFNANNIHMLNQRILSGYCSSSIPIGRYSKDLMNVAKLMININANQRPSIIDILNMEPVRKRIEGSDLILNDFNDYTIIRGLQTSIYPPLNINGWDRVVSKLREILNIDNEDFFKKESEFNYNAILKYLPPPSIKSNEYNSDDKKINNYSKLPAIRDKSSEYDYLSKYKEDKQNKRFDYINKNPSRVNSPPWAKHFY